MPNYWYGEIEATSVDMNVDTSSSEQFVNEERFNAFENLVFDAAGPSTFGFDFSNEEDESVDVGLSKGGRKKRYPSDKEFARATLYIFLNCEEVKPFVDVVVDEDPVVEIDPNPKYVKEDEEEEEDEVGSTDDDNDQVDDIDGYHDDF
ncbi:hypothetical protein ACFE04_022064 [Oxalis oulophora]